MEATKFFYSVVGGQKIQKQLVSLGAEGVPHFLLKIQVDIETVVVFRRFRQLSFLKKLGILVQFVDMWIHVQPPFLSYPF